MWASRDPGPGTWERRASRSAGGTTSLGSLALTAMAVAGFLAGSATGALPVPVGAHVAPYRGTHVATSLTATSSGCGKASAAPSTWSGLTGNGTSRVSAVAHQCSFASFGSTVFASSGVEIVFPIHVKTNGTFNVTLDLSATMTALERIRFNGSCPAATPSPGTSYSASYCYLDASLFVFADTWLVDTANWTYYSGSFVYLAYNDSTVSNASVCYSGSCSWSNYSSGPLSGGFTGVSRATLTISPYFALNSSHTYWLFLDVEVGVSATVYSSSPTGYSMGAHAGASLDLASIGNQWKLNWYTIK